jgi:hypothetical protein
MVRFFQLFFRKKLDLIALARVYTLEKGFPAWPLSLKAFFEWLCSI